MNPVKFMFVAGEPSGDALAAELVGSLRANLCRAEFEPRFFGAGGPAMRAAGIDTPVDMTSHSVIGLSDALKKILTFRRFYHQLWRLAEARQPDVVVCVDFSGFNRRLGHAIKESVRHRYDRWFRNWSPRLVQYVSPQVWASRPGRAVHMRRDFDLVLSIFPFEPEWYARNAPGLRTDFVGHPLVERYAGTRIESKAAEQLSEESVVLLPGSRTGELKRHLPVLAGALSIIRKSYPAIRATVVLPNAGLAETAKQIGLPEGAAVKIGGLAEALSGADLALASTGTVTMECAMFGVPTVAFYKTSWSTYQIGRRIVTVRFLAMPNILADEELYPEFVQDQATPQNVGYCAVSLLRDRPQRAAIRAGLQKVIASLGNRGASDRAAKAILSLIPDKI